MSLHTETSDGAVSRMTFSGLRYITTISLIGVFTCSMRHSFLQNVTHKYWATRMGDVIFPVIVHSLSCMMSRVTLVFTMSPRTSHGPFPYPGQPNSTHTIFSHSLWFWGLSDQKLRFSFDLKCVPFFFPWSHPQNFSSAPTCHIWTVETYLGSWSYWIRVWNSRKQSCIVGCLVDIQMVPENFTGPTYRDRHDSRQ
jgi:hypothetical protein